MNGLWQLCCHWIGGLCPLSVDFNRRILILLLNYTRASQDFFFFNVNSPLGSWYLPYVIAKHWRGVHCSLSSRELQGGIRVFGYKLCTCGLEKDRPENSRQGDSWRVHKAISEFYQLEWRNLNPHRALDWVLSHLSKHQADLQVTAHQNKIQYSLKEFNKIQHSAT